MVKRMKEIAENEQEAKNLNSELQQLEEIQEKLEAKLLGADKEQVCAEDTHPHTCRAQHTTTAAITALTHTLSIRSPTVYAGEEGGGDKGGGGGEGGDQEERVRGEDHGGRAEDAPGGAGGGGE